MDSLTYIQLLRHNRSFRRLWIGQVISELGNWFNFIAALGVVRLVSHAATEADDSSDCSTGSVYIVCATRRGFRRSLVQTHSDDRDGLAKVGSSARLPVCS